MLIPLWFCETDCRYFFADIHPLHRRFLDLNKTVECEKYTDGQIISVNHLYLLSFLIFATIPLSFSAIQFLISDHPVKGFPLSQIIFTMLHLLNCCLSPSPNLSAPSSRVLWHLYLLSSYLSVNLYVSFSSAILLAPAPSPCPTHYICISRTSPFHHLSVSCPWCLSICLSVSVTFPPILVVFQPDLIYPPTHAHTQAPSHTRLLHCYSWEEQTGLAAGWFMSVNSMTPWLPQH